MGRITLRDRVSLFHFRIFGDESSSKLHKKPVGQIVFHLMSKLMVSRAALSDH
jgi:hypothetical protein